MLDDCPHRIFVKKRGGIGDADTLGKKAEFRCMVEQAEENIAVIKNKFPES